MEGSWTLVNRSYFTEFHIFHTISYRINGYYPIIFNSNYDSIICKQNIWRDNIGKEALKCYLPASFLLNFKTLKDSGFARTNSESLGGLTPNKSFIVIKSEWQSYSCCIIKSIPGRMYNIRKWRLLCHVGNCSSTLVVLLALTLTSEAPAEQHYSPRNKAQSQTPES